MSIARYLQVVLLVSHLTLSIVALSDLNCQNFKFVIDEDVVYNHILEGHVFQRLTVRNAAQCHVMCKDDCLCVSMNYFPESRENNCELNDAKKDMEPAAMKWRQGGNYYDLVRSYTVKAGNKYIPRKHRCVNRCCRSNPCLNGGVCREICDTHSNRLNCTCPDIYTGQRCEKIEHPRSCKDIAKNGASASGKYDIFNSANEPFSVYCDLQSEPGFVWALIQSFSLAKNEIFSSKGFSFDFPVNVTTNKVDWNSYRLSLARMQSIANHSTHLRATCNFPTDGLQYTDYARAKLAGHDIFGNWSLGRCQLYKYINIRGINCSDCTARTKNDGRHKSWAINSYNNFGCQFDGRPGGKQGESSFGQYKEGNINSNHSCTSSAASTTQHWFGVKHDL